MNIRLFKHARHGHKWMGLVFSIFFIILSVSGILLMHYNEWGLDEIEVSGKYLPSKYFQVATAKRAIQSLMVIEGKETKIFVGTNRGLFRSTDAGQTWEELKKGLFNYDIRSLAFPIGMEDIVYAGTAAGIFKSEDGGDSWSDWFDEASGLENVVVQDIAVHPGDPERLLAATQGGLFVSDDGGESWEVSFSGSAHQDSRNVYLIYRDNSAPETLYIGTGKGAYQSTDDGNTWQEVWQDSIPQIHTLVAVNTDPQFLYLGTSEGLYKSHNNGRNWVKVKNRELTPVHSLFASPGKPLLMASGSQLFRSQNGEDRWSELGLDLKEVDTENPETIRINRITGLGKEQQVLLAATTAGLFISRDGGNGWEVQDLSNSLNHVAAEDRKMGLVKLITEIHTGRFFGSFFYMLVDLATVGLIMLTVSGMYSTFTMSRLRKQKGKTKPFKAALGARVVLGTNGRNNRNNRHANVSAFGETEQIVIVKQTGRGDLKAN